MRKQTFKMNGRALLLGVIAAAYPAMGYTAPAARVDFATGNVKAIGANGQSRTVVKGAQIEQGETISTNNGRAQLRFTDGAYVSLQPESELRIDQYRFDGKQDGNEKGFFSLLKGGLRTITGLVGRSNKQNYQVSTSVATIGIRGTEYTIQYGQSVTGTVGEGEINVCNGAGCLSVTNGESYYVQGQELKPVITNKRTDLPPTPPQPPVPGIRAGEEYSPEGINCDFVPCGSPTPTPPLTGTGNFNVAFATQAGTTNVITNTTATLNNGQLISFNRGGSIDSISGPYSEVGGDNILVWGRAAMNSGGELIHYAVGVPMLDFTPVLRMTGTYTLMGATAITDSSNNPIGKLTKMTMTANFTGITSASLAVDMMMNLGATPNKVTQGSGFFSGGSFTFNANDGGSSGVNTTVSGTGFFAGTKAERAGFVYSVNDAVQAINGRGAGGLQQTSLTPTPVPQ